MTSLPDQISTLSIDLPIFDGTTDLMCVRDLQGRLIRVNRAWQDTLGLSVDEVANTPLLPLVHPADVPATLLRMTEADRCEEIVNFVNRYRRKDGTYRHMEWRAQRLGDVILGRARDVTALRLRENELDRARQALEATLADLSDQVRTPAVEIMDTVQALGRTTLTHAQRAMVERMGRAVEALDDLLLQMLEREREVAWAAFLPTLERHRLGKDHGVWIGAPRESALPASRTEAGDHYPTVISPSAVLRSWVTDTLRIAEDNRRFSSLFRDVPSQTLGLLSIYLDDAGQLYLRRLQSLSIGIGLMSAGRAAALLARMYDTGFVEPIEGHRSNHAQRYRVLPGLLQPVVQQLIVNLQSMAGSNYKAAVALDWIRRDDKRALALLTRYAEALMRDAKSKQNESSRLLNGVLSSAQGQLIALSISAAAMQKHGPGCGGWIEMGLSSYATRFGVSRAHVHRIIHNLEAGGLRRDPASPSRIHVTSCFQQNMENYWDAVCSPLLLALDGIV